MNNNWKFYLNSVFNLRWALISITKIIPCFVSRYAEEFNQIESANVLKKFLNEIERRNSASLRVNDPNYHVNDEDLSLPPLGPAFSQNNPGIYDDPEAIQYAMPMVNQLQENDINNGNNGYSVTYFINN